MEIDSPAQAATQKVESSTDDNTMAEPQAKKQRHNDASQSTDTQKEQQPQKEPTVREKFTQFRDALDAHYDQRERVIKCSRDITALSKKLVFSLLRITQDPPATVFSDAERKHKMLLDLFTKLSKDLKGSDAQRYNRQATPGLQEYIEAIGLWVFLRDNKLISREQVEEMLGGRVPVSDADYVLGIGDLPGEVNRFCINSIGKHDHEAVRKSLYFLRELKEGLGLIQCSGYIKDLDKKISVLDSSLEKTEHAYYSMSIRETEMREHNISATPA
ncbi:hypothetical protein GGI07_005204 [Coemansia sp. Benny D115]|nr:hypothetical protein GGI07_005204 [Coemansia sp. Benny D115]